LWNQWAGTEQFSGIDELIFKEEGGYSSDKDSFEGRAHVAGQCQLFRRQCCEDIGGYVPHRAGGIDWMAVVTARMKNWKTESFRERWFFHYRRLGTADDRGHEHRRRDEASEHATAPVGGRKGRQHRCMLTPPAGRGQRPRGGGGRTRQSP